jgi:DNA-binding NarL/FixJ family response regulator
MSIRVLFASSAQISPELRQLLQNASLHLVCFPVNYASVGSTEDLWARVRAAADDVILLDWHMAEASTPELVRALLNDNPQLRIVVLLPQSLRQYRKIVWEAGACSSIPIENLDQEWLSSILCVMQRAIEREARAGQPLST